MTRDQVAATIIDKILQREGNIADVGDGVGITRFGQTPTWLETFGLEPPQTRADAAVNYHSWLDRTGLINLCDQSDSLADGVIDYAVHSGAGAALRALQAALKVRPDGVWGPVTDAAVASADRGALARKVIADRARLFGTLLVKAQNARFARGWLNRLAEQIEGL